METGRVECERPHWTVDFVRLLLLLLLLLLRVLILALTRIDMHTHETSTQRAHTIEHIGDTAQAKQQRE